MRSSVAALSLALASPLAPQAPTSPAPSGPFISTNATGEARVQPDRAAISFTVETRAQTASAAANENARRQRQVLDTLRAMGLPPEQISTVGYSVMAEQRYDGKEPRVVGYVARNTIRVELRRLDQTGAVIDAALGRGSNVVSALRFYSSRLDEARRTALAAAIAQARADAEAMARAAGGSLGALSEISTAGFMPMPREEFAMAARSADQSQTPIEPGEQTVTVTISARWLFIPAR